MSESLSWWLLWGATTCALVGNMIALHIGRHSLRAKRHLYAALLLQADAVDLLYPHASPNIDAKVAQLLRAVTEHVKAAGK